jgi:hypothetical protein
VWGVEKLFDGMFALFAFVGSSMKDLMNQRCACKCGVAKFEFYKFSQTQNLCFYIGDYRLPIKFLSKSPKQHETLDSKLIHRVIKLFISQNY